MGDGFIAVFADPEEAACACLEMQRAVNEQNASAVDIPQIRVGMGIHTGVCTIGAVGESERMDGTIIGDAVNLASRLETLTKRFKVKILASKETIDKMGNLLHHRYLGRVQVKGKLETTDLYEIYDAKETSKLENCIEFTKAVHFLAENKYDEASTIFETLAPDDPTSQVLLDWSNALIQQEHIDPWNGVIRFDDK